MCLQLSSADEVAIVEQNRSLLLSASKVSFGSPVQASWSVPVDEATNKDWIGELFNLFRPKLLISLPLYLCSSITRNNYLITKNVKLIIFQCPENFLGMTVTLFLLWHLISRAVCQRTSRMLAQLTFSNIKFKCYFYYLLALYTQSLRFLSIYHNILLNLFLIQCLLFTFSMVF